MNPDQEENEEDELPRWFQVIALVWVATLGLLVYAYLFIRVLEVTGVVR